LLRAAVGITAGVYGSVSLVNGPHPTFASWVIGFLALVSGALLLIGFLTPAVGAMIACGTGAIALSWLPALTADVVRDGLAMILVMVMAAAVAFLGPGAWSLDAWLFGRREITIPHEPRSTES
jgi:uncharacterized membrane protein YphA (DoxX/SURF4 family)